MEIEILAGKILHLIAIAEDAQQGYANVADDAEDATLKKIFVSLSKERGEYATQLQNQLRVLAGKKAAEGENTGAIARRWPLLKAAVINDDDDSIIIECIKSEEVALKEMVFVLDNIKSDSALSKLLVKQRNGINSSLNGIKSYLNNR